MDSTNSDPRPMWKQRYSKFMLVWAAVAHSWLLIQAIEIYDSKDASGVSLVGYIIYICSSIIWIVYGTFVLLERNHVIMMSSSIALVLGIVILIGILKYGDTDGNKTVASRTPASHFDDVEDKSCKECQNRFVSF